MRTTGLSVAASLRTQGRATFLEDSSEVRRFVWRRLEIARDHIRILIGDIHLVASLDGLEWAVDQPISQREARLDLYLVSKIASNHDGLQGDFVVGVERGDLHALGVEDERGERNGQRVRIGGNVEMNFGEGARPKLVVRVVRLKLDQRGARALSQRV